MVLYNIYIYISTEFTVPLLFYVKKICFSINKFLNHNFTILLMQLKLEEASKVKKINLKHLSRNHHLENHEFKIKIKKHWKQYLTNIILTPP